MSDFKRAIRTLRQIPSSFLAQLQGAIGTVVGAREYIDDLEARQAMTASKICEADERVLFEH